MIIGFGSDLVDIRRIEALWEKQGERFLDKIFTKAEQEKALSRTEVNHARAATLAKRFAAKEACVKALGKEGISWQEMEVTNAPSGKPILQLHGTAKATLQAQVPAGMQPQIDLSLSDEYPYAQAMVLISATPL